MVFLLGPMSVKLQSQVLQQWRKSYQGESCKLEVEVPARMALGVKFQLDVRCNLVVIGPHITKPDQILDKVVFIQIIS